MENQARISALSSTLLKLFTILKELSSLLKYLLFSRHVIATFPFFFAAVWKVLDLAERIPRMGSWAVGLIGSAPGVKKSWVTAILLLCRQTPNPIQLTVTTRAPVEDSILLHNGT